MRSWSYKKTSLLIERKCDYKSKSRDLKVILDQIREKALKWIREYIQTSIKDGVEISLNKGIWKWRDQK